MTPPPAATGLAPAPFAAPAAADSAGAGLAALTGTLLRLCGADLAVLLDSQPDGRARVAASAPAGQFSGFNLSNSGLETLAGSHAPQSAAALRLPSALVLAAGGRPEWAAVLPLPRPGPRESRLLLLWRGGRRPPPGITDLLPELAPAFLALLSAREESRAQAQIRDLFDDLFETVPSGIVLIDGSGHEVRLNDRAAGLLGGAAGLQTAPELSARMQQLSARCDNHAELTRAYGSQMADVDYRSCLNWTLGDTTLEVNTHPVRGNGEQGRIWLFRDITAEQRMTEQLRLMAALDPLTGVPNRRHFEERSAQIMAAREISGARLAIVMLDVDHFKRINDSFGHAAGDQVLKEIAARARQALRPQDLLARFGGEEFVVLMPVAEGEDPAAFAESLRAGIAAAPISAEDQPVPVTVSIGLAIGRCADRFGLEHLIRQADEALYRAKAGGRNRVEAAPDSQV